MGPLRRVYRAKRASASCSRRLTRCNHPTPGRPCASETTRRSSVTDRSRRRRSSSPASTSCTVRTWTRRSSCGVEDPRRASWRDRGAPRGRVRPPSRSRLPRGCARLRPPMSDAHAAINEIFKEENGRVIAALARRHRDLDVAEEAVQDAYLEALRTWPKKGTPQNPAAWITTVAQRRAIDRIRRDATYASRLEVLAAEETVSPDPQNGAPRRRRGEPARRATRADLRVLPSRARHRSASRAHAADAGASDDR